MNPNIIKQNALIIAGVAGDGNKTYDVWSSFEKLSKENPLKNKLSENGYEIRLYDGEACTVHVGFAVTSGQIDSSYTLFKLPASNNPAFHML